MSLSEAPNYGKQRRYAIGVESAYGTTVTKAGGLCHLRGLDSVTIDRGIRQYEHKTGNSKDPLIEESRRNVSGSIATATISGDLNRYLLEHLLNAHFQYSSAGTFTYFTTHPTTPFKSLTFAVDDPVAGRDEVYSGGVLKSFKVSAEKGAPVKFEAEFQFKGAGDIAQTLTNTTEWQTSGSAGDNYGKFGFNDITYQVDAGDGDTSIAIQSWSLSFVIDELSSENSDGSGGYSDIGFVERAGGTFEYALLPCATTELIKARARTGASNKLTLSSDMFNAWVTGQVDSLEYDESGLGPVSITAALKAVDEDSNMVEFSNVVETDFS